ncbi:hypothetical protein GE061_019607 [Apolygus lucorum]|uniref:Major facilitator superfamily (MFS) profile domain-containing protein n=1 Tax=Apolygus lucorum TaxID=248454 RepID=A0A6A4JJJ7_APOLU|nr:hypothetical protein GE061_019607 [Apolygus lucorum]
MPNGSEKWSFFIPSWFFRSTLVGFNDLKGSKLHKFSGLEGNSRLTTTFCAVRMRHHFALRGPSSQQLHVFPSKACWSQNPPGQADVESWDKSLNSGTWTQQSSVSHVNSILKDMTASTDAPKPAKTIGQRHKQACIMFLALVVAYMQRVNVSVGVVAMTDPTASSNPDVPTVNYTTSEKGEISSMFFYGYLVAGVPAGILADRFGPIKLIGIIGGILSGIGTVSIPFAATHMGFWTVGTLRIIQGLGQGFFYPCVNTHVAKWVTPQERSQFTWLWTGPQLGTIIMLVTGGQLAGGDSGWPAIFYYSGILSIVWGVFCLIFGADSPSKHKSMTEIERRYIQANTPTANKDGKRTKIPWKSLVTSGPFVTLTFNYVCHNWGFFTLLTLTPTYIHGVYGFSIQDNGFLSAIPYLCMMVGGFLMSAIASKLSERYSVNVIRKLFNSIGLYGAAIPLFVLSTFHTNATGAMVLLSLATTLNSGVFNGIQCNHLDLAPNLGGILMGITNASSNIASLCAPLWAGFFVKDESNAEQWQIVFLVSAALYVVGNTAFLIFGSTDIQPWNDPTFGLADPNFALAEPKVESNPELTDQLWFHSSVTNRV